MIIFEGTTLIHSSFSLPYVKKSSSKNRLNNNIYKKLITVFAVLLIGVSVFAQSTNMTNGNPIVPPLPPITIEADGSINPPTAPIEKIANNYTLTENLTNYRLEIRCNNITFNGAAHTLEGERYSAVHGITIQANRVTITNTNIGYYELGGITANGSGIIISGNNITGPLTLVGSYNKIIGNIISGTGIRLGETTSESSHNIIIGNTLIQSCIDIAADYNTIYLNNFMDNRSYAVSIWFGRDATLGGNVFDDGRRGNYWSNYVGPDSDSDGIGDTPYVTRVSSTGFQTFNYPLIKPVDIAKILDSYPPVISVISPQNATYLTSDISLSFSIDELTLWISYSLDEQTNITITGNNTLSGLLVGSHAVTIYANDTAQNTGTSQTIFFTIIQQPTLSPSPTVPEFPSWIILTLLAIASATFIMLRKRIKNQHDFETDTLNRTSFPH